MADKSNINAGQQSVVQGPQYGTNYGQPLNGQQLPPPYPSAPPPYYDDQRGGDSPHLNRHHHGQNQSFVPPPPPQHGRAQMPYYATGFPENPGEAENGDDKDEDHQQFNLNSFSDKAIRMGFVRKVFGILTIQLLVTFGTMAAFVYYEPLREFTKENKWIWIVAICSTFVIIIALACCGNLRRKTPFNYIFLGLFTIAWSWMLGSIAAKFSANEVWLAIGIVCGITLAMCFLGMQTKIDLTWTVGLLMILLVSLIGFGIICAIVRDRYLYLGLAAAGAGFFSIWLLVDIKLLMGGQGIAIDPEEYVFAALNIYLDVINILLRIFVIIGLTKN